MIDVRIEFAPDTARFRVPNTVIAALDLLGLTLQDQIGWLIQLHLADGTTITATPADTYDTRSAA